MDRLGVNEAGEAGEQPVTLEMVKRYVDNQRNAQGQKPYTFVSAKPNAAGSWDVEVELAPWLGGGRDWLMPSNADIRSGRFGGGQMNEAGEEAPAAGKGWLNGRPSHAQIWANGKPLTIVRKGPRAWTLLVMNHPVVDLPDGSVTFHGRSNFQHGLPEHVFKTQKDVESAAFTIGHYMLGLGQFMDTYVHHATAGGEATEAPAAVVPEGQVCRPWVRMEKDPQAFNACMALSQKLGAIEGHDKLYEVVRQQMEREDVEVFYAVVLGTHLELRAMSEIARGARDRVQTPMADLCRFALYQAVHYGGMGLAVAHTHPSGARAKPSTADRDVTKAVEQGCEAMGIMFVDHIIVSANTYYSFKTGKTHTAKPNRHTLRPRR
jgi:hypothetical protein